MCNSYDYLCSFGALSMDILFFVPTPQNELWWALKLLKILQLKMSIFNLSAEDHIIQAVSTSNPKCYLRHNRTYQNIGELAQSDMCFFWIIYETNMDLIKDQGFFLFVFFCFVCLFVYFGGLFIWLLTVHVLVCVLFLKSYVYVYCMWYIFLVGFTRLCLKKSIRAFGRLFPSIPEYIIVKDFPYFPFFFIIRGLR